MCSEYQMYSELTKIEAVIGYSIRPPTRLPTNPEYHVKIYGEAPIILLSNGVPEIKIAQFSLKPPGTTYSTFNARLADWNPRSNRAIPIYEKTTWRGPFERDRCLIPMSSFLEPIYIGEHAGSVLNFASPDSETLLAAGIYEESPHPKKPNEVYRGFSIIVHSALDFVLQMGHHRSPHFLKPTVAMSYLADEMSDDARYQLLLTNRFLPSLVATKSRTMAKGWEKRIAVNLEAHEEELEFKKRFRESS